MNPIIQTVTNNIEKSLEFYSSLDFDIVHNGGIYYASDNKTTILINTVRTSRPGLRLYNENWDEVIKKLQKHVKVIEFEEGYVFSDPSGTLIYLINSDASFLPSSSLNNHPSKLGNFSGLSLEMIDIESSLTIWGILGFKQIMGSIDQGWISLQSKSQFTISLMKQGVCPHLFFNPSLSYFNGKNNLKIIKELSKMNIPFTEEITHFNPEGTVDNIIIRDPGGLGFFLFSD